MFRGYDDRYVFNFDTEFISNIHKILKDFKKNTVGYPAYMNSADEWQDIFESMITKLETIQELQYEEGITEELEKYEELEKVKNEFFVLFSKYVFSLWY